MFYVLIAKPLQFFYELWPNYAGAIALLTLSIMILLLPLTLKGTRSMLAMQKLQPEMKKLQAKHRDDRQKLNEEMMKFYKENNINPVSGCMPLLLQMPVFFFLYRTLYQLLNRAPYGQDMGAAVAAARNGRAYEQFGYFRPKHLDASSRLFQDLSSARQMRSFGLDLAESAFKTFGSGGIGKALPYLVLVLVVTATSFIQQRQIAGRNPQAAQANPQQAMMMKIIPLFLSVISLTLPAGIVVYFLVSNTFRIGQQALITRTMYGDGDGPVATTGREVDGSSADERPKGFSAQLREMSLPDPAGAREEVRRSSGSSSKAKAGNGAAKAKAGAAVKGGGGSKAKGTPAAKAGGAKGKAGPTGTRASTTGGGSKGSSGSGAKTATASKAGSTGSATTKTSGNGSGAASGGAAARPSRAAPQAANRSRNKKKRK